MHIFSILPITKVRQDLKQEPTKLKALLEVAKKQHLVKKYSIGNLKVYVALKLGLTRLTCVYNVH